MKISYPNLFALVLGAFVMALSCAALTGCTYDISPLGELPASDSTAVPSVVDTPATVGDPAMSRKSWSQSGQLVTGDPAGVVSMQTGDLTTLDYSYYTVTLSSTPPADGAGYAALATVQFVVNGIPNVRQVTVGQSVEISGPADSITVRAIDDTPAAWGTTGQPYSVSMTCVPGTRVSNGQPLLRDRNAPTTGANPGSYTLTPGEIVGIPVPQGIGIIGAWVSANETVVPLANPAVLVDEIGGPLFAGAYTTFQFQITTPEPLKVIIAPGTGILAVENTDTSNQVIFTLVWIIDG